MPGGSFTIDAWITGDRWQHHRVNDHYGPESDLYVVLSEDVGKYVEGTPLHHVVEDMVARIVQLENYQRTFGTFSIDADITDRVFTIDAVISGTIAGSFTIDADIKSIGSFTIDADIVGRFTIDAMIV